MKLLFVASRFPYPPIQGDRARGYHHLRILSRQHNITLVTPPPGKNQKDDLNAIHPLCERIEVVPTSLWRKLWRLSQAPFTSLPLQTLYVFDARIREKVQKLLEKETFDVIHVQLVRMAPIADYVGDMPKVLDFIDALSLNMARRSRREHGFLAWLMNKEAQRVHHYEQALIRQYDQLLVSSPVDRDVIGDYDNIHVIPNGVNIADFPFIENRREPGKIVFTGRMGYFPNADAAIWFTEQVLPLIRQQMPQAQFFIVGADPTPEVRTLAQQPGVFVTGYVADLPDYLHRATVAVAPLRAGSGMQFKVIEAMCCGTPVVATPYALGGIEAVHGQNLLIAEDAKSFAEQVVRLLNDKALQHSLAYNARRLVEEKYTWERTVTMLENVYCLAKGHSRFAQEEANL